MENKIVKIRRSLDRKKYCACNDDGTPIRVFEKISDIRKYWAYEIRRGKIQLVRELDQIPETSGINETINIIDRYLKHNFKKVK